MSETYNQVVEFAISIHNGQITFSKVDKENWLDAYYDKIFQIIEHNRNQLSNQQLVEINESIGDQFYHIKIVPDLDIANKFQIFGTLLNSSVAPTEILHEFFNQSQDAYIIFNHQHQIVYSNALVENYMGINTQQLNNTQLNEFSNELKKVWSTAIDQCLEKEDVHRVEFQMPDGMWIDWVLVPHSLANEKLIFAYSRDISQQKRKTLEVSLTKENLLDALRISQLATWELYVDKKQLVLNEQLCALLGISYHAQSPQFLSLIDFINRFIVDEERKAVESLFEDAIQSSDKSDIQLFEFNINREKTKGQQTLLMSIHSQQNEKGVTDLLYGTMQDISTIKATEKELEQYRNKLEQKVRERTKELRESEDRLTDALKLARLGTWSYDFRLETFTFGGIVPEILELEFLADHESANLTLDEFKNYIHPDDWPSYYAAAIKAVKSLDPNYLDYVQYRVITPDGKTKQLQVSVKIEFNELTGEHTRHFGTIQDITGIKEAELENRRLTEIIEATPDIVAVFNVRQGVEYLNKSARQFYGINENEHISKLSLADLVSKNELIDIRRFIKEAVRKGIWSGEYTYKGHKGEEIAMSQVILAHKNSDNEVTFLSTILRDITQQKETEKNLVYKNHELDTFVYRASHDLRGPITSLFGLINVAKYDISDSKAKTYMEMFDQQVHRLNNIIGNLMELTKIKEKDLSDELIDFSAVVEDSIHTFSHLSTFKEINFKVEVDEKLNYYGDKGIILTIIQNLIENSIKYARKEVESIVRVQIKYFAPNDTLHIKITDNGMGIPDDYQEKIFNMFFRATESSSGTGLGLYILKNAVERLNGNIRLHSKEGEGTVFSIFLPFKNQIV